MLLGLWNLIMNLKIKYLWFINCIYIVYIYGYISVFYKYVLYCYEIVFEIFFLDCYKGEIIFIEEFWIGGIFRIFSVGCFSNFLFVYIFL